MPQRLTFILNREVDQRSSAAKGRGNGAGLKIVGGLGSAERHVEMRVDIDAARKQQMIAGIDGARSVFRRQLRRDGGDFATGDADVSPRRVDRGDDRSVLDDGVETHWCGKASKTLAHGRESDFAL